MLEEEVVFYEEIFLSIQYSTLLVPVILLEYNQTEMEF